MADSRVPIRYTLPQHSDRSFCHETQCTFIFYLQVNDIFEFLTEHIKESNDLEGKKFFIMTLGNMKLPEATRHLLDLALNGEESFFNKHALLLGQIKIKHKYCF